MRIYTSDDGTNFEFKTGATYDEDVTFDFDTRVIRLDSGVANNGAKLYYLYLEDVEYLQHGSISIDGVTSNTINNIPCDILLQPSTKYELIYNEDSNKFEEKGILYDITLAEAVNQVDLNGIENKLKIGKLYELIVIGNTSVGQGIMFGTCACGYISDTSKGSIGLFIMSDNIGTIKSVCISGGSSGDVGHFDGSINGNEYIKIYTSQYKFNTGTRIIIKEVA